MLGSHASARVRRSDRRTLKYRACAQKKGHHIFWRKKRFKTYVFFCRKSSSPARGRSGSDVTCTNHRACAQLQAAPWQPCLSSTAPAHKTEARGGTELFNPVPARRGPGRDKVRNDGKAVRPEGFDVPRLRMNLNVSNNFAKKVVQNICVFLSKVDCPGLALRRERRDPHEPPRLCTK